MMDREGMGARTRAATTRRTDVSATRVEAAHRYCCCHNMFATSAPRGSGAMMRQPVALLFSVLMVAALLLAAGFALLQPASAFASKPGGAAYYEERWQECLQKMKPVETGLPVWDGRPEGTEPTETEMGDDGVEYRLARTAEEFRWCLVNNVSVKLMNDIDLGWRGEADDPNWYGVQVTKAMHINGDGHTVYNLRSEHASYAGLIGHVAFDAGTSFQLTGLNLEGANVKCGAAQAALISHFWGGTVADCAVSRVLVYGANLTGGLFSTGQANCGDFVVRDVKASEVYVRGSECTTPFFQGAKTANSVLVERCSLTRSAVIVPGGHAGGFVSCFGVVTTMTVRDCFADVDVYGNTDTGVFVGVVHWGNHEFVNCFSTGKIESANGIGGFLGNSSSSFGGGANAIKISNCYSTAMVGMGDGGKNMGSFIGMGAANLTVENCYAAGEVGTLRSDIDGMPLDASGRRLEKENVTGFCGNNQGNFTNCYYDKQTTAMCDIGTREGVSGLITSDLIKLDLGAAWVTSSGGYPELKVFAESKDDLSRSVSAASTSTVHLYASEDGADYDTVRRIRYPFPLTSNANSGKADIDTKWGIYVGEDPSNPLYPNVSPIVPGDVPIIMLADVGSRDNVPSVAPGVGWLEVEATDRASGVTGQRRLRLVPTTSIALASFGNLSAGDSDVICAKPKESQSSLEGWKPLDDMFSIYDHRSNVSFVSSSSFALNSFLLDEANYGSLAEKLEKHPAIKTLEFPRNDDGAFIDGTLADGVLHFELGDDMEGDLLDVTLVRRNTDGVFEAMPWTPHLVDIFSGRAVADASDLGTYRLEYTWTNAAGDVVKAEGHKTIDVVEPAWAVYHLNDGTVLDASAAGTDDYDVLHIDPGSYPVGGSVGAALFACPHREGSAGWWTTSRETGEAGARAANASDPVARATAAGDVFDGSTALKPGRNDVYAHWADFTPPDPVFPKPDKPTPDNPEPGTDPSIEPDPYIERTVVNETDPGEPLQVGDKLAVTVEVGNREPGSVWRDVAVREKIPEGLSLDPKSLVIVLPDGTRVPLPADAWNPETRTVIYEPGNIAGGEAHRLEYAATIEEAAATEGGDAPIGPTTEAVGTGPGDVPVREEATDPLYPTNPEGDTVFWADPDPLVEKTAENLTRPGERTHVGDRLRYAISTETLRAGSLWKDVVIFDEVPEGLAVDAKTMKLALPNGRIVEVAENAYDKRGRTIAVYVGDLKRGEKATLTFEATVESAALHHDVGNRGAAKGGASLPGGGWIEGGPYQAGDPYHPRGGMEPVPEDAVRTGLVYAHGKDVPDAGGVLPRNGLATRLAQTGDPLTLSVLSLAVLSAAAVAAFALHRRRSISRR